MDTIWVRKGVSLAFRLLRTTKRKDKDGMDGDNLGLLASILVILSLALAGSPGRGD